MEIKTKLNARVMQGGQYRKAWLTCLAQIFSANKITIPLVCYTAVFSVVTQRSSPGGGGGGELLDDTKNGCVAD